jgi:ABC-type lipoprotein release transport system permease subunit
MNQKVLLVSEAEARCYSIKVGDKVTMRLRSNNFGNGSRTGGPVDLTVIGIVSKGTAGTNKDSSLLL